MLIGNKKQNIQYERDKLNKISNVSACRSFIILEISFSCSQRHETIKYLFYKRWIIKSHRF